MRLFFFGWGAVLPIVGEIARFDLVSQTAVPREPQARQGDPILNWELLDAVSLVLARARSFAQAYSGPNSTWSALMVSEIDRIQKRLVAPAAPRDQTPPADELRALAAELRRHTDDPHYWWDVAPTREQMLVWIDRLALLAGKGAPVDGGVRNLDRSGGGTGTAD